MAMFHYLAKNLEGQSIQGEIAATSSQEALRLLRREDILVTRLTEVMSQAVRTTPWKFSWKNSRVTNKELVVFTHQFATLIRAGVPLLECLDILGSEADNPAWQPIIKRIHTEVEQGALLAQALEQFPALFQEFYRRMIKVGETTGRLDESLSQLAVYLEKQAQLRAKIVGALTYPALLMSVAIIVFVFLLIWVVPLFSGLFQEFGESLPWLTQMVLDLSNGLRTHALVLFGVLGILAFGGRIFLANSKSRRILDGILLGLPMIGAIFRKAAIVRFARTLGFVVRRGVPLLTGLSVAGMVAGNSVFAESIEQAATQVQDGKPLSEALRNLGVFPLMVTQMIKVGESTGSLDTMLEKIADLFELEVERVVATLTSVLEPSVIVLVGSGIALVVVAMYLPIFSMGSIIG